MRMRGWGIFFVASGLGPQAKTLSAPPRGLDSTGLAQPQPSENRQAPAVHPTPVPERRAPETEPVRNASSRNTLARNCDQKGLDPTGPARSHRPRPIPPAPPDPIGPARFHRARAQSGSPQEHPEDGPVQKPRPILTCPPQPATTFGELRRPPKKRAWIPPALPPKDSPGSLPIDPPSAPHGGGGPTLCSNYGTNTRDRG